MGNRGQIFRTVIGLVLGILLLPTTPTAAGNDDIERISSKALQAEAEANARLRTWLPGVDIPQGKGSSGSRTPLLVLYDQTANVNANATSQNFEAAFDAYDNQGADDFMVTAGGGWNVTTVFAPGVYSATHGIPTSMRVAFYQNAGGVPGALICDFPTLAFTEAPVGSFTISLPGGCLLGPGPKWVSVVANLTSGGGGGQWFWSTRTVLTGFPSTWQNPGGGFGTTCSTWGTRTSCLSGQTDPDFAFRLDGDITSCQSDANCDDGNVCNGYETCVAGSCVEGFPIQCSDNLFCTIESCDPPTGICSSRPNSCTDGNSCTVDSCDEATDTCTHSSPVPIYFCNSTPIVIPATGTAAGVAAPYPSSISVSGLPTVSSVCDVELLGMNHTWEGDVDVMLVSPLGATSNRTIMSDVGGNGDFIDTSVQLIDSAASSLPTANGNIATGSYKPTNNGAVDTFDAPAPAPTGLAPLSAFDDIDPNGTWSLFVRDDASGDVGNISRGWCLAIVVACTNDGHCQDGNVCNGIETCVDGTCVPGIPVWCPDGLFCTIDSCDPATGMCNYVPTTCDDGNPCTSDSCDEANDACVNTNGCISFCAPDPIALNDSNGGTPPTAASPYPSTITVSGLPSPASVAQVRLMNINHTFADDLDMLLVGPVDPSVNAMIMSDVGGSQDVTSINLTLSDSAAGPIPDGGPLVSGSFRPTNVDTTTDAMPLPAPSTTGVSPLGTFGSGNQNGTWSLYSSDDANVDSGTMTGGWCLDFLAAGCTTHPDCNDSNPCTTDLCNADACAHNPNNASCDDGNVCTDSDQCSGGACQPGVPRDCSDGDPCTADSCSQPSGCQHLPGTRPGDVPSIMVGNPNKQTVSWSTEPASSLYDVVRGNLSKLPVGPMDDDEVCFGDMNSTSTTDNQIPPLGQGFFYVVRGVGCDAGPYGDATAGPRETATCDDIELVSPTEGEIINEGALVEAQVPVALHPFVEWVHFEYSSNGTLWLPIEGVAPAEAPGYHALWHATPLAPGNYMVRGLLKILGRPTPIVFPDATRHVLVNAQPNAQFEIISCQTNPGPPVVGFSASGSSDPDGGIASYFWDFGDGTTATGPVVTHHYSSLGQYSVGMTTTDVYGAPTSTFAIVTVDLANDCRQDPKSCGCASMDIKTDGAIDGPANYEWIEASSGIPAAEKGNLGPYNDGVAGALPAQLDMTKASFCVKFRFEVIATLKDKSKPQLCTEGQRAKLTLESGGAAGGARNAKAHKGNRTSDARYDSSPTTGGPDDPYVGNPPDDPAVTENDDCGAGGAAWCDDDYHGGGGAGGQGNGNNDPPNGYKKYDGQTRILWLDAPGYRRLGKAALNPNGVAFKANFESKVSGPLGTCTCTFDVTIEIDNAGKVTKNELTNESCTSSFAAPSGLIGSDDGDAEVGDVRQVRDLRVMGDETSAGDTRFEYSLADPENITIVVVDSSDRAVRTLTDGVQTEGAHVALWDQRDEKGDLVPDGSYRYIVQIGTWKHEGRLEVGDGK